MNLDELLEFTKSFYVQKINALKEDSTEYARFSSDIVKLQNSLYELS